MQVFVSVQFFRADHIMMFTIPSALLIIEPTSSADDSATCETSKEHFIGGGFSSSSFVDGGRW